MDAVSLAVSLITVVSGVIKVIKEVRAFYQASEELETLLVSSLIPCWEHCSYVHLRHQDQIEQFERVVAIVEGRPGALTADISTILNRAKTHLEQLKVLLETKILSTKNAPQRVRRRAWAKRKSKVYSIQSTLREDRLNLVTALAASREIDSATSPAHNLHSQLFKLEQSVSDTQNAVSAQTSVMNSMLQFMSGAEHCRGCLNIATHSAQSLLIHSGRTKEDAGTHETFISLCPNHSCVTSKQALSPRLLTPLERSSNFYGESYTIDAPVPRSCLLIILCSEQSSGFESRTCEYKLLYMNSFRHWQWINISLQISRSSAYWATTKVQSHGICLQCPCAGAFFVLPYPLLRKLQEYLSRQEAIIDDATFYLSLTDGVGCKELSRTLDSVKVSPLSRPLSGSSTAIASLHDIGCHQYPESEVVQLEMVSPPSGFCSSLNGQLVFERKFMDSIPCSEMLYNIRVLHCMNGSPGFPKLVGIVTDDSQRNLKSFLVELPKQIRTLDQILGGPSFSWERREKWATELVYGVYRMHSQGFVVGKFKGTADPFIDETDSILFWTFRKRFMTGYTGGAYYPPEFCHVRAMLRHLEDRDRPQVTSKADIFWLGSILWRLAENKPYKRTSPLCDRMQCTGNDCDLSHTVPIALPRLPEHVPPYFREIVDACRRADPRERPAARELVKMFLCSKVECTEKQQRQSEDNEETGRSSSQVWKKNICSRTEGTRTPALTCNLCHSRRLALPSYHCNFCNDGDYDICQTCFDLGRHCANDQHLLAEITLIGNWPVAKRYHTCARTSTGLRDVIEPP